MKNIFCFAVIALALSTNAQTNKSWAFGLGFGLHGNSSAFSGGNEMASGKFEHATFGSAALQAMVRYDYNDHWMFMTGIGFLSYGFEFSRNADYYSLKHEDEMHRSVIRNEFGALEIPVMIFYKSGLNCRNARWVVGGGFAGIFSGKQNSTAYLYPDGERNNPAFPALKSDASAKGGAVPMLRFSVGRERILKRGGILQAALWFNWGFTQVAEAEVSYTVDGQTFHHKFSNTGNFVGLRVSYFFSKRFKG